MQRINTTTKYPDKFGVGKHGFRNGDLANAVVPTDLVAEWFDGVQEEISRVIEASGATLDGTVFNQLYVAIMQLIQNSNYDRPGRVNIFLQGSAPAGWLPIHGLLLPRADFPGLTAHALSQNPVSESEWSAGRWGWFSTGDGATTIRIPDIRAMVIRALDASRGIDVGRLIGSYQASQNLAHVHTVTVDAGGDHGHVITVNAVGDHAHNFNLDASSSLGGGGGNVRGPSIGPETLTTAAAGAHSHTAGASSSGTHTHTGNASSSGGSEVRVANIAWPFYIKY